MAYVTVPKDLSKIKAKVLFGLTKRQLVCFTPACGAFRRAAFLFTQRVCQEHNGDPRHDDGYAAVLSFCHV